MASDLLRRLDQALAEGDLGGARLAHEALGALLDVRAELVRPSRKRGSR